ncbi:MAG: hypothetical protein ACHQ53_09375 [Polyangiales bacterium]
MSAPLCIRVVLVALVVASCSQNVRSSGPTLTPKRGAADAGPSGSGGALASGSDAQAAPTPAADGDSGAAVTELQACTDQVGSCPAYSFGIWQELLNAADFGAGARLVAMGGQAVVVALGDGTFRVARLHTPSASSSAPPYDSWQLPANDLQPIAVAEGPSILPGALTVLSCNESHSRCSVSSSSVNQGALAPWQETDVPSELVARGVVLDTAPASEAFCVYGNGMQCLRNAWLPAIASSSNLQLNDVAMGPLWSIAVGEHGRWFKRERADSGTLGAWQEQAPLGGTALTQASVDGASGVIVGEGWIRAAFGREAEFFGCTPSDALQALMLDPSGYGSGWALMQSGDVLQHWVVTPQRAEPYCAYQHLALASTVLATGAAPCGAGLNPRVLTAQVLIGTNVCLETP